MRNPIQNLTTSGRACFVGMAFLVGAAIFSPAVSAQQATDQNVDEPSDIEEVVVTASRREETLQNVAMSLAILDTDQLAKGGLTSLPEILPFVPGVIVSDSGGSGASDAFIRGINATNAAGVGVYIDDIPYGSSTVDAGGGAPVDGTLLDLQQLEVLKGPQGTLYGSSAMGGLFKFRTRDASLEEWTANVSADLSSTHGGGLNQLYRVAANGPIVEDSVGLSFTAFWKDKTGYIDNVTIPKKHWDDYEYYGGSASLLFQPSDKLWIKAQTFYQKSTQDGLASIQVDNDGVPYFGKFETGEMALQPSVYESTLFGLTAEYDYGFATLTSVTSYQEREYSLSGDFTVPYAFLADLFFPENAPHTSALLVADLGWDKFTQELRLTSASNQKFEWLVGAFYSDEDGFNTQELITEPVEDFFYVDFPSNYREKALFGTGTYYFTPDFDMSLGLRASDTKYTLELEGVGPLVSSLPKNEHQDNVTTYLFNLRYRPSENMATYARAANGYRPGGANAVATDPSTGQPSAPPFYLPDNLWSYEVGIKGTSSDRRFSYDVAGFYIDWQDYIISIIRSGVSVTGNADHASSKGFEGTVVLAATEGLTLTGTLSYIDAKLEADEPDLGGAKGEQLPYTPKWSGSLRANYRFNLAGMPAFVNADYRYNGKFPVGFDGVVIDGVTYPSSAPRYINDSYSVVNVSAGVSTGRYEISLYANNLLNEYAYASVYTNYFGPGGAVPLRPLTVGVVLQANF